MFAHRSAADAQDEGDVLIAFAVTDPVQDLLFAEGQRGVRAFVERIGFHDDLVAGWTDEYPHRRGDLLGPQARRSCDASGLAICPLCERPEQPVREDRGVAP